MCNIRHAQNVYGALFYNPFMYHIYKHVWNGYTYTIIYYIAISRVYLITIIMKEIRKTESTCAVMTFLQSQKETKWNDYY